MIVPDSVGGGPSTTGARVAAFDATLSVPLKLTNRAVLMPAVSYSLLSIRQNQTSAGVPTQNDLHTAALSLLFHYRFTENWNLTLRVAPALSGDFVDLTFDHFRISGLALATYRFSDRFTLGGGLLATLQFGEPLPLPAIQLRWEILDSLRLDALLPSLVSITWRLHDRVELSLSASVRGQLYTLTSQRVKGRWPCRAEPADNPETPAFDEQQADTERCFSSLAYAQGEVGPSISVRLASSLWLSVRAAFPFFRRYEFTNESGETPDIGDLGLESNVLVRAQLSFRIPEL